MIFNYFNYRLIKQNKLLKSALSLSLSIEVILSMQSHNSSKKLPRHFVSHQTFHVELSQSQASTLHYLLPKGCSLSVLPQSKSKQKSHANIKTKPQENIYAQHYHTTSHHHYQHSLNKHQSSQKDTPSIHKTTIKSINKKQPHKQQISQLVKPCLPILQQLKTYKHSWPFLQPVDAQALGIPQYYQIVVQPMDLSTIQSKMKSGQYKTPLQFYRDVNLMIKNSYIFNQANQQFLKITNDFQKYFWRIAGPQSKPIHDKKLQREKQKERQRQEKEKAKQEKLREKMLEKEKQRQRKLLLQQQQQAEQALKLAKKKKKMIPKDILQAQNISVQEKQQLANNIHNLPKQHLKGIKQIVFTDTAIKQQDQHSQGQQRQVNTNQFDIQKIGYKKIRQLQKYVRIKMSEIQNNRKFTDEQVEKRNEVDLDLMDSECSEEFVQ